MPDLSRRNFIKYATYGSALAGTGLLSPLASIGKEPAGTAATGEVLAVCISDFHIGERYGGVTGNPGNPDDYLRVNAADKKGPYVRKEFVEFLEYCKKVSQKYGKIKYLIILGDMWDLAMNNQESSFGLSTVLFRRINELDRGIDIGGLFENIIYVPGNHDHHFWEMIQEKYWVTDRLEKGLEPLEMPRTISLTVDAATGAVEGSGGHPGNPEIPLHNLVSSLLGLDGSTPVYVAYPHIFLKNHDGGYTLMTHGHLFEPNWNMVTMMFGELMEQNGIPTTIRNIEMFNAITTEMHSYALGQTPPYEFWEKIYDSRIAGQVPQEWEKGIQKILEAHFYLKKNIEGDPETISLKYHDIEALQDERGLVEHFLAQAEKEYLNDGGRITSLIYGHTHIPSFGETFRRYRSDEKSLLKIYNTGGWVTIDPDRFKMPEPMLIYGNGAVSALRLQNGGFHLEEG